MCANDLQIHLREHSIKDLVNATFSLAIFRLKEAMKTAKIEEKK